MHESKHEAQKRATRHLRHRYDAAPPAARRHLDAEIDFILQRLSPHSYVLELGCGYGRVLARVRGYARMVYGIDISVGSLLMAREFLGPEPSCRLAAMDACSLAFPRSSFDVVLCIQNGLSSLQGDAAALVREAIRVARPNGEILISVFRRDSGRTESSGSKRRWYAGSEPR
jgi:2-polyprenyl-6-hydroxyphenyl methylase/3-demethylubiquinone-9 3-methyltransferase